MIDACLRPQAEAIAATLGDKYEEYIASLGSEQAAKLTEGTRPVVWSLAQARVCWELAINQQLQEYVSQGKAIPKQGTPDRTNYIAIGTVTWGARPGLIWGIDGAMVEIPFAFTREDHPILDKARATYEAAYREFDSVFSKQVK